MLNQIVEHSSQTSELVEKIATVSTEQAQGITQVSQGLHQIDAVTQQNTASAEETASVAGEMNSQTTKLHQMIQFFKLK
ncbi:hypothetical protein FACS189419_05570 [Planctomycetales bacterium]|nr:hypothetical protein FACS189419_05570 [Planctomycetales bacterium]